MRRVIFQVHLWVGLITGVLIVLLGLSGSALVFRTDVDRWSVSEWLQVSPRGVYQGLDAAVARALREHPSRELSKLIVPSDERSSVEVVLQIRKPPNLKAADLISVYVDPYTLAIVGQRRRASGVMWWLQDLHYALFAGEPGLKVNGIAALGLLLLTLSGPMLWWPSRGRWRQAFTIRRGPPLATWRDLHAVTGVIGWLALMLITLTALYFAFRGTATAALTLASGAASVAPPAIARPMDTGGDPETSRFAALDALIASARDAEPGATFDELRPARSTERPASVSYRLPGDSVPGRHRMFLDPVTATVLRIDRHESLDAGGRLFANMTPWHFGTFGGRLTQVLWFVAGLIPALLFGSGAWLWLRKRLRKARSAAAA